MQKVANFQSTRFKLEFVVINHAFILPAVSTLLRFFPPIQSKHIPFQDMEQNNKKVNKTFLKKIFLEQNQTMSFFSTKK